MANVDSPFGLRPVMHRSGAPYNGGVVMCLATGAANDIFLGDPVIFTGSSNAGEEEGHPAGSVPIVNKATNGQANNISGVVVGVVPVDHTSTVYAKSGEERLLYVCTDPDVLFEVQDGGTGGVGAAGAAYNLTATGGAGSTTSGRSGVVITAATGGTGAQVIVERASATPGNDITAAYAKWLVSIQLHTSRILGDL